MRTYATKLEIRFTIEVLLVEIGAPMLSVLVINQNRNRPGKGFFKLYAYLHGLPMKAVDEETVFISEFNELVNYHHWDEVKFRLGI